MNNNIDNIINEFESHLNSKKFHNGDRLDNYININDVLLILNDIRDLNRF